MYTKTLKSGYKAITTDSMISFLNEDTGMDDPTKAELDAMVLAAVKDMEAYTHRDWAEYNYTLRVNSWIDGTKLVLPRLHEINTITVKYLDTNEEWQNAEEGDHYKIGSRHNATTIAWLPAVTAIGLADSDEVIEIKWAAGYATDSIPENMLVGVKLWVRNVWDGVEDDMKRNDAVERIWNAGREFIV